MTSNTPTSMLLLGLVHLLIPTIAMFAVVFATAERNDFQASTELLVTAILGGAMYTATGLANIALLRSDKRLAPEMVYTNSIMCWSSFFFGPAIALIKVVPFQFLISYGHWYCVPNFGWGVEWGLQLLGDAGTGPRGVSIMFISIISFFLSFAFEHEETGFNIAFLPQVAAAIAMCVYCFVYFRSVAAGRALAVWVTACGLFLVLAEYETSLVPVIGQSAATLAVQVCDCNQIHFSTRFFVCMFRTKHARGAAATKEKIKDAEASAGSWWC